MLVSMPTKNKLQHILPGDTFRIHKHPFMGCSLEIQAYAYRNTATDFTLVLTRLPTQCLCLKPCTDTLCLVLSSKEIPSGDTGCKIRNILTVH